MEPSSIVSRYGAPLGRPNEGHGLVDVLDRVLDKGVVIAGDIAINLLDIELLTIKVRLLIASADKAKEMGIDWWAHDPALSSGARRDQDRKRSGSGDRALKDENQELRERIERLEAQLSQLVERRLPGASQPQRQHRAASGQAKGG